MSDDLEFPDATIETEMPPEAEPASVTTPPILSYPASAPTPPVQPSISMFQVVVGLLMISVLLLSSIVVGSQEAKLKPSPTAPAAPTAGEGTSALTTETVVGQFKEIETQLKSLAAHIKDVRDKVDSLPAPAPAVDLTTVQEKVDALSRSVAVLIPVSTKVGDLDKRLGGADTAVKSLQAEFAELTADVSGLRVELKKRVAATPAAR